ncbi:MAG TPA: type II CAAX endopeptidase family protein [Bacilli bacterium]|nr:type II CAAX endopeptidase family protein [Bacilli bacterium]
MKKTKNYLYNFLIIASYFFYSFLGIIPVFFLNYDVYNLTNKESLVIDMFASILYLLIILFIYRKTLKKDFVNFNKNKKEYIEFGFKFWLYGIFVMVISNLLISNIIPSGSANEQLVQQAIDLNPIYMIFTTVIFAPLVEELLFRKAFKDLFPTNVIYIIMSALAFGFLHVITNIESITEMLFIIPYGALGASFAYMYVKKKNIIIPIFFHMIHNAILITFSIIINILV